MIENEYESDREVSDLERDGRPEPIAGKEEMTFEEWLAYGTSRSWNSAPICFKDDGTPPPEDECTHYILVYKNYIQSQETCRKFPPAAWRHHSRGTKWWNREL